MEYFLILCKLGEFQEFAEALFGQLSVELDEEKEIIELAVKAKDDIANKVQFKELDEIANSILPGFKNKVEEFLGVKVPENITLKFPDLGELKKIKGNKSGGVGQMKNQKTLLQNYSMQLQKKI